MREIQVSLRELAQTTSGVGVFLTDGAKTIAVFVDPFVASAMAMLMGNVKPPRPLTHDLLGNVLAGFGIRAVKVVICDLKNDTFFARLYLQQEDAAGRHIVEIDARPSDSIVVALQQKCPIFVVEPVWNRAQDMSWILDQPKPPPEA